MIGHGPLLMAEQRQYAVDKSQSDISQPAQRRGPSYAMLKMLRT
jgi:hypothetical protein